MRAKLKKFRQAISLSLIVLSLLLTGWVTLTHSGQSQLRAVFLVNHLLFPDSKAPLHVLTEPPIAETVSISTPTGAVEARYYRSVEEKSSGALILSIGYPANLNDPLLTRLADDLARLGVAVLVPHLPGLRVGTLTTEDVEVLVTAFEWLSTQPEIDPEHIGFAGFCIGSSLALLAAEDPRINEQVALVNVFGGYYNLLNLMRAVAAHSVYYEGEEHPWQPAQPTVAVFAQNVVSYVDDPAERTLLMKLIQEETNQPSQPLSPTGTLAYQILTTTDPATVDALLAQIPPDKQAQIAALSPSTNISNLKAKVFIMQDLSDPFIPVTETTLLANALEDDQKISTQFVLFDHIRPNQPENPLVLFQEGIRLVSHLSLLLAEIIPAKNKP